MRSYKPCNQNPDNMENAEVQTTQPGALAPSDNISALDRFTARLNEMPPQAEVKANPAAGNSWYLPVSFVQMKLDEIFLGLWSWEVKSVQVVANEILVHGELRVFHPIAKAWITRSGTGATMIMQVKDAPVMDITSKIKNTLGKDFPHAEAEALKSAAKKLGKAFGRDLNRKDEDTYESEYFEVARPAIVTADLEKKIAACKTVAALTKVYKEDSRYANYAELFTARKTELAK